jgi:hypothetical protein
MKYYKLTFYKVEKRTPSGFEGTHLKICDTTLVPEIDLAFVKEGIKRVGEHDVFYTIEEMKEILHETHTDN